jgi:hypothetical protein
MEQTIEDRYTNGIWYDTMNGDFAKIRQVGELVELVNPENGDVYWDMPVEDWEDEEKNDFVKVRQEAVDDPVAVVNRAIRMMSRNDINELSGYPFEEAIALRYARQQVTISEE